MPTARIEQIAGRVRRITGSADVPLNAQGREQSAQLASRTAGDFDKVFSSPMQRAMETARAVDPAAKARPQLGPWKLGRHEGAAAQDAKSAISGLISERPYVPPGESAESGKPAESFHQFKGRVLGGVQKQIAGLKPDERVLNVTHGRNIRLVQAWLKKGAPADRSIDKGEMLRDGDWSQPGSMARLNGGKLEPAQDASKPGLYFARHGETNWSAPEPQGS